MNREPSQDRQGQIKMKMYLAKIVALKPFLIYNSILQIMIQNYWLLYWASN